MPYIVKSRIKHNGERFEPGDVFKPESITKKRTEELLVNGTIEDVPARAGRPPTKKEGDA